MKALCKPLRCLSFLGGKKPPAEYAPVDGQAVGKPPDEDDDDEDDFFGDGWGPSQGNGDSAPSKAPEVKSQSTDLRPSRETTTKRSSSAPPPPAQAPPQPKANAVKKETDFFNELGMEPEYKAPRILDKGPTGLPKGRSVSAMLEEGDQGEPEAGDNGWGTEDLDLKL